LPAAAVLKSIHLNRQPQIAIAIPYNFTIGVQTGASMEAMRLSDTVLLNVQRQLKQLND
jgi:hypothetical protein